MDKMRKTDMTARERTSHEQDHSTSKSIITTPMRIPALMAAVTICFRWKISVYRFPCMSKMTAHDLETIYVRKNMRFG